MTTKHLLGGIAASSALLLIVFIYVYQQLGAPAEFEAHTDFEIRGIECSNNGAAGIAMTLHRGKFSDPDLRLIARRSDLDLRAESTKELQILLSKLGGKLNISFNAPCNNSTAPFPAMFAELTYRDHDPVSALSVIRASLTQLVDEMSSNYDRQVLTVEGALISLRAALQVETNESVASELAREIGTMQSLQAQRASRPLRFHILNPPKVGVHPANKHGWAVRVNEARLAKEQAQQNDSEPESANDREAGWLKWSD